MAKLVSTLRTQPTSETVETRPSAAVNILGIVLVLAFILGAVWVLIGAFQLH